MLYPYQYILECGNVLLAAAGPVVDSYSLDDRSYISFWEPPSTSNGTMVLTAAPQENKHTSSEVDLASFDDSGSEPPTKKRRIADLAGQPETAKASVDSSEKNGGKQDQNSRRLGSLPPAVISLTATENGRHVIAVTGEDKTIHVLEHDGKGGLRQLSQRAMLKRPCAIALTPDQSTIVCADKFGDVYSLPLLINEHTMLKSGEAVEASSSPASEELKPFVSAANHFTVHSARNRRALQNQMKQTKQNTEKAELGFGHELLLGHVSMLTDVALIERGGRNYIITADRDEHIRISRGIPQAHVIEGFCLGHTEFVSRLCVPKTCPEILVSGGGDEELYIWRWLSGQLLLKVNMRTYIDALTFKTDLKSNGDATDKDQATSSERVKIAVSKIVHVKAGQGTAGDFILATCELIPAIFFFSLLADGSMEYFQTVTLDGNPLSVTATSSGKVLVSVDWIFEPGSSSKLRRSDEVGATTRALRTFHLEDKIWIEVNPTFQTRPLQGGIPTSEELKSLSSLLYNVENLRKRGGED